MLLVTNLRTKNIHPVTIKSVCGVCVVCVWFVCSVCVRCVWLCAVHVWCMCGVVCVVVCGGGGGGVVSE